MYSRYGRSWCRQAARGTAVSKLWHASTPLDWLWHNNHFSVVLFCVCVLPRANTSRTQLCGRTLRTTRQFLNTTSYRWYVYTICERNEKNTILRSSNLLSTLDSSCHVNCSLSGCKRVLSILTSWMLAFIMDTECKIQRLNYHPVFFLELLNSPIIFLD